MRPCLKRISGTTPSLTGFCHNWISSHFFVTTRPHSASSVTTTMSAKWRAALIDLSGTVHIEDQILPGAKEGIELLRKNGVPLKFVTNTTKESCLSLIQRLRRLGLDISDDEILTSLTAAKMKVEEQRLRPLFFLEDSALEEFDEVPTSEFDSVVVGLAPHRFNHESLSEAMNVLLDGGKLIAIHKARFVCSGFLIRI